MNAKTKGDARRRCRKRIRLALLFLGLGIVIIAWFLDQATAFPWVLRYVAPDYVVVQDALVILDKGEKETISLEHPGAQVLLSWWTPQPPAQALPRLSGIGRSTGILDLPNATQFYQIRMLADDNANMLSDEYVWRDIDVRARMEKTLDDSMLRWGAGLFALGILLSAAMGVWDHLDE